MSDQSAHLVDYSSNLPTRDLATFWGAPNFPKPLDPNDAAVIAAVFIFFFACLLALELSFFFVSLSYLAFRIFFFVSLS